MTNLNETIVNNLTIVQNGTSDSESIIINEDYTQIFIIFVLTVGLIGNVATIFVILKQKNNGKYLLLLRMDLKQLIKYIKKITNKCIPSLRSALYKPARTMFNSKVFVQ